jgi:hypothetical protein
MPAGIQIFNADGSVHVDITTRLTKIIGALTIDGSAGSGSISHAAFSLGIPWVFPLGWVSGTFGSLPVFVPYSDRIDWYYVNPSGSRVGVDVLYGIQ